jgi:hypothetical protein
MKYKENAFDKYSKNIKINMKFYDNQKFGRDKIIKLYRQLLEKLINYDKKEIEKIKIYSKYLIKR